MSDASDERPSARYSARERLAIRDQGSVWQPERGELNAENTSHVPKRFGCSGRVPLSGRSSFAARCRQKSFAARSASGVREHPASAPSAAQAPLGERNGSKRLNFRQRVSAWCNCRNLPPRSFRLRQSTSNTHSGERPCHRARASNRDRRVSVS